MKRLSRLIYRYDLFILLAAVLLTVLAIFGTMRIRMVSNVALMLPRDDPAVSDYLTSLERMGTLDYLVVLLSAPDRGALTGFSNEFSKRIIDSRLVSEINYTVTERDKEYILNQYLPNLFLYLDDEDFKKVKKRLEPKAIAASVSMDRNLLLTPISAGMADFVVRDPLDLLSIVQNKTFSGEGGFSIDTSSGYFLSVDGKHLLMLARPVKPPQDIDFDHRLFSNLTGFEKEIKKNPVYKDVLVEYTGGYPIAVGDESMIRGDLNRTLTIASVLVLLLFYLVFRRFSLLFFVGPCLNLGILWTLGFAGFALGHLNMVTVAFGAILAGLGMDYSIHFYNGFLGEIFKGEALEQALENTFTTTGRGILTAALTNSVAFFSMVFTQFAGLSELGIIGGFGILLTVLSDLIVLPSIIVRFMKIRGEKVKYLRIPTFGMGRLGRFAVERRRGIIFGAIVVSIVMGIFALRVGFETDANRLRPKNTPALEVQEKIMHIFSGSSPEVIVTAEGGDLEKVLTVSEEAERIMKKYPEITKIEGPGAFLPSVSKQLGNIKKAQGLSLEKARSELERVLVLNGFQPEPFLPFLDTLSRFSRGDVKPVTYTDLTGTVGETMTKKYVSRVGNTWYVSLFAYPRSGVWEKDIDRVMVRKLKELSPGVSVASITMVIAELKQIITKDFLVATLIAALGVLLILIIQFREVKGIVFCFISLGMGVLWMVGCMGLFNIPMNFANIVVFPMVIGFGIDNNTHLYHRFRENRHEGVAATFSFTGRAVIISTLTSLAGFGSLIMSRYGGLKSIGVLAVVGLSLCLVTALLVLPALIATGQGRKKEGK
jgi:predicted RND superfamily exporter protein